MLTRKRFEQLRDEWNQGTLFDSLPAQIFGHPAYKAIIAEGEEVIPMILAEMEAMDSKGEDYKGPCFWFRALYEILNSEPDQGDDPDPPIRIEDGFSIIDIPRANRLWLNWAKAQGWKPARSYREWMDEVFAHVASMLDNHGFKEVDNLLSNVHVELTPISLLVGYLSITLSARQELAERVTFYEKVKAEITRRGMGDRLGGLLSGLE